MLDFHLTNVEIIEAQMVSSKDLFALNINARFHKRIYVRSITTHAR